MATELLERINLPKHPQPRVGTPYPVAVWADVDGAGSLLGAGGEELLLFGSGGVVGVELEVDEVEAGEVEYSDQTALVFISCFVFWYRAY